MGFRSGFIMVGCLFLGKVLFAQAPDWLVSVQSMSTEQAAGYLARDASVRKAARLYFVEGSLAEIDQISDDRTLQRLFELVDLTRLKPLQWEALRTRFQEQLTKGQRIRWLNLAYEIDLRKKVEWLNKAKKGFARSDKAWLGALGVPGVGSLFMAVLSSQTGHVFSAGVSALYAVMLGRSAYLSWRQTRDTIYLQHALPLQKLTRTFSEILVSRLPLSEALSRYVLSELVPTILNLEIPTEAVEREVMDLKRVLLQLESANLCPPHLRHPFAEVHDALSAGISGRRPAAVIECFAVGYEDFSSGAETSSSVANTSSSVN